MRNFANKTYLKILVFFSLLVLGISLISVYILENQQTAKVEDIAGEKNKTEETAENTLGVQVQPSPSPVEKKTVKVKAEPSKTPQPSQSPTPSTDGISNLPQNPVQSGVAKQEIKENAVSVSVNNSLNFSVKVTDGANQCDVLSKALSDGKLQSLNMKYSDSLKTNAVYRINGQGKENEVWWVYKVNGSSPPLGCSLIKANNGDNVLWEYAGP